MEEPSSEGVADAGPEPIGEAGSEAVEQPDEGGEPEPPRQYVEIEDPDNRYVRVKVDGEDVEVPYSEALKGYSRESHFTRSMQQVAQQRQEAEYGMNLQRALEANPAMTLQILAQQYGLGLQGPQQQAPEPEPEYTDPLERAVHEERQARLALEDRITQKESDEALARAVEGLRSEFNLSNEDLQQVIGVAYQNGYGFDALPMIYKTMAFDRLSARVRAAREAEAQQQAETERRTAAKRSAGQVVSSGARGAGGLNSQVDSGGRMTLREAIEAAFDQAERG